MAEKPEELCRRLAEETRRILGAAGREDMEAIGGAVAGRERILTEMAALRAARPDAFAACQASLRQAAALNARAARAISGLCVKKREELRLANRSFGPLMRYADSRFGLATGMILDRVD